MLTRLESVFLLPSNSKGALNSFLLSFGISLTLPLDISFESFLFFCHSTKSSLQLNQSHGQNSVVPEKTKIKKKKNMVKAKYFSFKKIIETITIYKLRNSWGAHTGVFLFCPLSALLSVSTPNLDSVGISCCLLCAHIIGFWALAALRDQALASNHSQGSLPFRISYALMGLCNSSMLRGRICHLEAYLPGIDMLVASD